MAVLLLGCDTMYLRHPLSVVTIYQVQDCEHLNPSIPHPPKYAMVSQGISHVASLLLLALVAMVFVPSKTINQVRSTHNI